MVKNIKNSNISKKWSELFPAIEKRPEMYLYEKSAICLAAFVAGIHYAEMISGDIISDFDFDKFEAWVANTYNPSKLSLNSYTLASYYESEPERAFNLWYKWYYTFTA